MSIPYTITRRARRDLSEIWSYSTRNWGEVQADSYVRTLIAAFDKIATGALVGRSLDDIRSGYFRLLVGSHIVYYKRRSDEGVHIVRILHGRTDPNRHL